MHNDQPGDRPIRKASKEPSVTKHGDGYLMNAAACAFIAYKTKPRDIEPGAPRDRILRFQARVRAQLEAMRKAGTKNPSLTDAIAAAVDLDRVQAAMGTGDLDAVRDAIYAEPLPC
jgi:hypothetical protein